MTLPRIPHPERTRTRRFAEALYRSEPAAWLRGAAGDLRARLRSGNGELPPHRLQEAVGGGDFTAIGEEFRRLFIDVGGLRADHDVLDVGSGSGRMAYALDGWLAGRYEGFDVMPDAVEWCRRNISARNPRFGFQLADIRSERYNPSGRYEAADYRFPYPDACFDFAFLTSVFTHLQLPAVEHYVSELARVLRPGGRCFATYFLINDEAIRAMGGFGAFWLERDGAFVVDERVPERAVAFHEGDVIETHSRARLPIEAVHYGSWCGREHYTSFQDIVISVLRA